MNEPSLAGVRVLIVDDEEEFARTLANRLELRGLRVVCAFSGEVALQTLTSDLPEVLLLDMRMPGMSGVELLRALRIDDAIEGGRTLPVIVVSGHADISDIHAAEELGIQGYMVKPVDFSDLLNAIRQATGRAPSGA